MRNPWSWLNRAIASCLVLLLLVPFSTAGSSPQQMTTQSTTQTETPQATDQRSNASNQSNVPTQSEALPDSPGSQHVPSADEKFRQSASQQPQQPQQNVTKEPVGTAVAESVETTGVAASNPAGAAIAPAKQRRSRAFFIKVGAIVGAGAAVGAVAALSSGSPSRPPSSR